MTKTLCTTASLLSIMATSLAIAAEPATSTTTAKTLSVYTTAKDSNQRLTLSDTLSLKPGQQPPETDIAVFVNPDKRFQTFFGMGGAITDASAEVFSTLKPAKKSEFLKAYYDQKAGIGYSLLRTTIHSSDFSSGSYTYIKEGDKELTSFSIFHQNECRSLEASATCTGESENHAWPPTAMRANSRSSSGVPDHGKGRIACSMGW